MPVHDFKSQRLFVSARLFEGAEVVLDSGQAHYLAGVLRMNVADEILVFDGESGEWRAKLAQVKKRHVVLQVLEQVRPQDSGPDIDYLFAPLKRARLDYMVQKSVEMGVRSLQPVLTRYTVAERVNGDRMLANAIEAAEQCGVLRIPDVAKPQKLTAILAQWDPQKPLIFCDEAAGISDPVMALKDVPPGPLGVLIGPEGGFAPEERTLLRSIGPAVTISLGPRIMRADTAAVAALTLVNAVLGDWRENS